MVRQNIIPRRLATCPVPVCSACLYAKATRKPWRSKRSIIHIDNVPTKSGEVVSVDQMVSPTPGLVAQMTGKLTTKRYKYATVFVDQASRLGYVYLQKTATADETLVAKDAFERYAKDNGTTVNAYHADNGIFKAHAWVNNCTQKQQRLTFAGVNAHHQNGIVERRIRELQELAQTMLIHAAKRWPAAITANMWPYAIRAANDALNEVPNPKLTSKLAPLNLFSNNKVSTNAKH